MSGHDAQFPFLLVPEVKLVIALDQLDFVPPDATLLKPVLPEEQRGWLGAPEVMGVGEKVLANILNAFPGATITKIEKIIHLDGRVSGYVRFVDGKGAERGYLHISSEIEDGKRLQDYWWASLVPTDRFALAVKASMGLWHKSVMEDIAARMAHGEGTLVLGPTMELKKIQKLGRMKWINISNSGQNPLYGDLRDFSAGIQP